MKNLVNKLSRTARHNKPTICIIGGVVGFFISIGFTVIGTKKAIEKIDEKKKEENKDSLTPVETVKTVWSCYVLSAIAAGTSVALILKGEKLHARNYAAWSTAYTLTNATLEQYRAKTLEAVGEKKEKEIRSLMAQNKVDRTPVKEKEIVVTEKGNYLCFDPITSRYFWSNIDAVKKSINNLNARLMTEMYLSYNEYCDELGLPRVKIGDDIGWNVDDGLIDPCFDSALALSDETPCLVIDFLMCPKAEYKS